jgi:hypothetical protein
MVGEVWRDVQGYEGLYQVSNLGRVKSLNREVTRKYKSGKTSTWIQKGKVLKAPLDISGYPRVALYKNYKSKFVFVHRLVAQAFLGSVKVTDDMQVNHMDGIKTNNYVDNLEWCTRSENMRHAHEIGVKKALKGEELWNSKLTEEDVREIKKLLDQGETGASIARRFSIHPMQVSSIKLGKAWAHVK